MTMPISDERLAELVDMLGIDTDFDEYGFSIKRGTLRGVFARIEALTAERQLQTGMSVMMSERSRQAVESAKRELMAEGERRATAAIVAWLQVQNWAVSDGDDWRELAGTIERGDHLTPAKPPTD